MRRVNETASMLIYSKNARRLIVLVLIIAVCLCSVTYIVNHTFSCAYAPAEDISCHYDVISDDLPDIETSDIGSDDQTMNNIFFHQTSCSGDLTPRQACAVESAARSNPEFDVHVVFSAAVSSRRALEQGSPATSLRHYSDVSFWRVHLDHYVYGTPLQHLLAGGKMNRSRLDVSVTSELLRFTTLYKYPGIFLDLDMIVVGPLSPMWNNFAARESEKDVSSAVFAFSDDEAGRSLALDVANEFAATFDDEDFERSRTGVMTRVLHKRCRTDNPDEMTTYNCRGVAVYDPEVTFPIARSEAHRFFEPAPAAVSSSNAQLYRLWDEETSCLRVPAGSLLQALAQQHCPQVYQDHPHHFGG